MPKIRIKVAPDLCIGAASCVTVDPAHFELNEENKAVVLDPKKLDLPRTYEREVELTTDEYENLLLAAQSCPTLAIFLYDENGTQLFPEV